MTITKQTQAHRYGNQLVGTSGKRDGDGERRGRGQWEERRGRGEARQRSGTKRGEQYV